MICTISTDSVYPEQVSFDRAMIDISLWRFLCRKLFLFCINVARQKSINYDLSWRREDLPLIVIIDEDFADTKSLRININHNADVMYCYNSLHDTAFIRNMFLRCKHRHLYTLVCCPIMARALAHRRSIFLWCQKVRKRHVWHRRRPFYRDVAPER